MTLPQITATGRLGCDVELTFTPAGKALAKFRIACGERIKDRQSGEWKDGDTTWLNIALWESDAEAAADHLKKGDEVTVVGLLLVRDFEAKDGSKGCSAEVKWAKVYKALPRLDQGNRPNQSQPTQQANPWGQQPQQPAGDPWSTGPAQGQAPF